MNAFATALFKVLDRQPDMVVNGWLIKDTWSHKFPSGRSRVMVLAACPGCGEEQVKQKCHLNRFENCRQCDMEARSAKKLPDAG